MHDIDDTQMTELLGRLRFAAPPLDTVWAPGRSAGRPTHSILALGLAIAAVLVVSIGSVAAVGGWFNTLQPKGECLQGDMTCGPDYTQASIKVDHVTDTTMVNILVKPGLSSGRLTEIAALVVERNPNHRVIVYLLSDLPSGAMDAGFAAGPADDAALAPPPPANLVPYWLLTYDDGPSGVRTTHP
jgi:hypothetical protein